VSVAPAGQKQADLQVLKQSFSDPSAILQRAGSGSRSDKITLRRRPRSAWRIRGLGSKEGDSHASSSFPSIPLG
jgi:hypothetical protein